MRHTVVGIQHVGLTVRNLDEALAWFSAALGFHELFREEPFEIQNEHWQQALDVPIGTKLEGVVMIGNGAGCEIELFQYAAADARGDRPRNFDNGGHHLALQVSDLKSTLAQIMTVGAEQLGDVKDNPHGPWEGADWIYLKTPFGLYIELLELPEGGIGFERETRRRIHRPLPNVSAP